MRRPPTTLDADILDAARRHDLVLCVGPGLAAGAGLPDWLGVGRRLLTRLAERDRGAPVLATVEALLPHRLLDGLDVLARELGRHEFVRTVQTLWRDAHEPTDLAREFARFARHARAVWTSNLDFTVEGALNRPEFWYGPVVTRAGDFAGAERCIVKICGGVEQADTWALTLTARAEGSNYARLREQFRAVLRGRRVLFLGFAPRDEILADLLLEPTQDPRHWLVAPELDPATARQLQDRGVQAVEATPAELCSWLAGLADQLVAQAGPARPSRRIQPEACPYPGLFTFSEADAGVFFGRDRERDALLARLQRVRPRGLRWLSLEGPSGVGKSSLLFAGLLAPLRRGDVLPALPGGWDFTALRPGLMPLTNLAQALALAEADLRDESGLRGHVRRLTAEGRGLVLAVDQLEELSTFADPAQRAAFEQALLGALRDDEGHFALITTLRSDQVASLGRDLGAWLNRPDAVARFTLAPLTDADLRAAVVGPALARDVAFEPGLVTAILGDVRSDDGSGTLDGSLPILAHVLRELWHACAGASALTHERYEALGRVQGALTTSADQTLAQLGDARERARVLLVALADIDDHDRWYRRSLPLAEARRLLAGDADRVLNCLMGQLQGSADRHMRVLVTSGEGPAARVDLIHEALLRRWTTLRDWLIAVTAGKQATNALEQAAERWGDQGQPKHGLVRGVEMKYFLAAAPRTDLARRFQAALRRNNTRARRRLGLAVLALLGLTTVSIVATLLAVRRKDEAQTQAARAEAARKDAEAAREDAETQRDEAQRLRAIAEAQLATLVTLTSDEIAQGKAIVASARQASARGDDAGLREALHDLEDQQSTLTQALGAGGDQALHAELARCTTRSDDAATALAAGDSRRALQLYTVAYDCLERIPAQMEGLGVKSKDLTDAVVKTVSLVALRRLELERDLVGGRAARDSLDLLRRTPLGREALKRDPRIARVLDEPGVHRDATAHTDTPPRIEPERLDAELPPRDELPPKGLQPEPLKPPRDPLVPRIPAQDLSPEWKGRRDPRKGRPTAD